MSCLVFETPGLIDLRAFTLMGVSAKPATDSPIGYFSTGLKYSIAALVRMGTRPVVWIGRDRYTFTKQESEFRGVGFDLIAMKRERFGFGVGRTTPLPYTTMYGRTWKPWMVLRELEANTRDEGGRTYLLQNSEEVIGGKEDHTCIVVDNADVIEAYRKIDEIFLPGAERGGRGVQVINQPSRFLYWRGLKVYELSKPTLHTYNILDHVTLTEDRTLQGEWHARALIAQWVTQEADGAQVEAVVTADDDTWEHELEFDRSLPPGPAFRDTMVRYPKQTSRSASVYWSRHDDRVTATTYDVLQAHPLPWSVRGSEVVDAKGRTVFDAPYGYEGRWDLAAAYIVERMNSANAEAVPA